MAEADVYEKKKSWLTRPSVNSDLQKAYRQLDFGGK